MASIRNLKLSINKMAGAKSEVSVSYDIVFSALEAAAGATYHEKVVLRGDDVLMDENLGPALLSQVVKAHSSTIHRKITKMVSNKDLDEDPDTILLGFVLRREDELYARVTLAPFMALPVKADSDTVKADLGLGGP